MELHGLWRYSIEDRPEFAAPEYDDAAWSTMPIPSNWFLAGLDHHGVVWFRYRFDYSLPPGRYATLRFEGVDYFADVYLNGAYLGRHAGYFEPFAFEVTEQLRPGSNLLAVRVDSPYEPVGPDGWHIRKRLIKGVLNHHDCRPGGGWEDWGQSYNTGGIWNRVLLLEHGALTIDRLLLRADLSSDPPRLVAELWYTLRDDGGGSADLVLEVVPEGFEARSYMETMSVELSPGEGHLRATVSVPEVVLWEPWDRGGPRLYRVRAAIRSQGEGVLAERETLYGFREVQVDRDLRWYVNGKPYVPRGSNYIASQWLAETLFPSVAMSDRHPFPPPEDAVLPTPSWFERDVALMRKANLNAVRVHAHVLPQAFYDACDRAGILVWQDFALQWGYADDPDFHAEAERQMKAMVLELYNHPSIVVWCCHNETPWDAPWMALEVEQYDPDQNRALDERLEEVARMLDPTRYVHRNSGTGDGHVYPGWYYGHWRDFRRLPAKPLPTEYGAQALPGRTTLVRMFGRFGPDAGYTELVRFKEWLDARAGRANPLLVWVGMVLWMLLSSTRALRPLMLLYARWLRAQIKGILRRSIPSPEEVPLELRRAREVWATWCFHDFQPDETFRNARISLGDSLDAFVENSQRYQAWLIQYATETYRRSKGKKIHGLFQFMFVDPWPAITWSVLDYWRKPKLGYEALRRAMQPVLPSAELLPEYVASESIEFPVWVVNDRPMAFEGAVCHWRFGEARGVLDCSIPADDVVRVGVVRLPRMAAGEYVVELILYAADGVELGRNRYEVQVGGKE